MINPFRLNQPIGEDFNMDLDDSLNTKKALADLGHLKVPDHGLTEFPDRPMIDGVKSFQRDQGLKQDGVMKPDGPTIKRLNETLAAKQKSAQNPPSPAGANSGKGQNQSSPKLQIPPAPTAPAPHPRFQPITLKLPVTPSSNVDLNDTGRVKAALDDLGLLNTRNHGLDPFPDAPMFDAIKAFQRETGLRQDGEMKPGGETVRRLNEVMANEVAEKASDGSTPKDLGGTQVAMARRHRLGDPGSTTEGAMPFNPFGGGGGAAFLGTALAAKTLMDQQSNKTGIGGEVPPPSEPGTQNRRTDIAVPLPPLPGFEPPDEKLPDRTESIPTEKIKELKETYPALEEIDTIIEGFPDQRDELIQILILQASSRGTPKTQARNNFILDRMLKKLKEMNIEREHVGGGTSKEFGFQKEHHFEKKEGLRARRSDGRIKIEPTLQDIFFEEIQTVDTLVDGETLTKREGDAARDIKLHKIEDKERGGVSTYPKIPDMQQDEWEQIMGPKVDAYVEAAYGQFRKK